MVVARASLALTCDVISAFQSTLDVVLVPDVEVEFVELVLEVDVLVVEVVLLTEVMAKPPVHRTPGPALTAGPRVAVLLTQQFQQILRHLVGGRFRRDRGLCLDLG
jgi:hypothetical protein